MVQAHHRTAEEQLLIVRGEASAGMQGTPDTLLGAGGFAMVASKPVHRFTCTAKEECLMFETFDRAYDMVWVKDEKQRKMAKKGETRPALVDSKNARSLGLRSEAGGPGPGIDSALDSLCRRPELYVWLRTPEEGHRRCGHRWSRMPRRLESSGACTCLLGQRRSGQAG